MQALCWMKGSVVSVLRRPLEEPAAPVPVKADAKGDPMFARMSPAAACWSHATLSDPAIASVRGDRFCSS